VRRVRPLRRQTARWLLTCPCAILAQPDLEEDEKDDRAEAQGAERNAEHDPSHPADEGGTERAGKGDQRR
jgi:hypothetical protein